MPTTWRIRVRGRIDPEWSSWLGGLRVTELDCGDTELTGSLPDQAALYGVLARIRDLGLALASVSPEEEL